MSNRVLKIQLVMRNSSGGVINRSDVLENPLNTETDNRTVVDIIRQWSRIGFAVGDSFTIEEIE